MPWRERWRDVEGQAERGDGSCALQPAQGDVAGSPSTWGQPFRLLRRVEPVKVLTSAMVEALSERGFVSRKKRRVLLRPSLPVEVSVEKERVGPAYGISIYFGGPGVRHNVDEDVCL